MKNLFKEYHQFTEEELKQLWQDCLFIFDTNALLNLYRYKKDIVEKYFSTLNKLKKKNQIWIPYQVWYEFFENRISVISENESLYDKVEDLIEKIKDEASCKYQEIQEQYKHHPYLNLSDIKIKDILDGALERVKKEIKETKKRHPKLFKTDDILNKVIELFTDNTWKNFDIEKLNDIMKEWESRYEKNIPPGFKDKNKKENKYGDLILWYQIIEKAQNIKKPIILISDDVKEDWWLKKNGERLCPLPQLKKEMYDKAGVDFHIYTIEKFLEHANPKIDKDVISEVRRIREIQERERFEKIAEIQRIRDFKNTERLRGFTERHIMRDFEGNNKFGEIEKIQIIEKYLRNCKFCLGIAKKIIEKIIDEEIPLEYKEWLKKQLDKIYFFYHGIRYNRREPIFFIDLQNDIEQFFTDFHQIISNLRAFLTPDLLFKIGRMLEELEEIEYKIKYQNQEIKEIIETR